MTASDLLALLPLLVLSTAAIAVVLLAAFWRNRVLSAALAVLGLGAACLTLPLAAQAAPRQVTPLAVVDGYGLFYMGLICAASIAVVLFSYDYWKGRSDRPEEFNALVLLAALGSAVLVASRHFASFFLGLEVLSVSLYALIAYQRTRLTAIEAGIKYLVLAATSAAFLLFGMALFYAETGTLDLPGGAAAYPASSSAGLLVPAGLALVLVGIGFKLALVPFHLWTPDVYQGAPVPVTALIATVSKGAVFALLLRYVGSLRPDSAGQVWLLLAAMAVASMLAGNLLALRQNSVKRLLAYSSIAHLGYLLVAFLAGGPWASVAAAYYLTAYFVTTLGAFGAMALLSENTDEADSLRHYQGLGWRRPWLAGALSASLLSLAGIPLTAGFIGKVYVLAGGAAAGLWWLLLVLVVGSAIGLYYYLRVVTTMYMQPAEEQFAAVASASPAAGSSGLSLCGNVTLLVIVVLLLWLGIYPATLLRIVETFSAAG